MQIFVVCFVVCCVPCPKREQSGYGVFAVNHHITVRCTLIINAILFLQISRCAAPLILRGAFLEIQGFACYLYLHSSNGAAHQNICRKIYDFKSGAAHRNIFFMKFYLSFLTRTAYHTLLSSFMSPFLVFYVATFRAK